MHTKTRRSDTETFKEEAVRLVRESGQPVTPVSFNREGPIQSIRGHRELMLGLGGGAPLTYVWTREGWLYLAVLLDLYSRRVVGWAMGQRLTGELAEQALLMAVMNRTPRVGLLHHSDRGSQYAATSYQHRLAVYGLIPSMSRKGNCWDNACVESFFGTLKRELVSHRHYATRDEAQKEIFEYIEVFYNRQRRPSTLGYHSPAEYEARAAVA